MSQDTVTGSPWHLNNCSNEEEPFVPAKRKSTRLNFESSDPSDPSDQCSTKNAVPPNSSGEVATDLSSVLSSGPSTLEDRVLVSSRRDALIQQQQQFLERLTPEELKFEKTKVIIMLKLREENPGLDCGSFELLFESFLQHFAEHQTLPPSLSNLAQILKDEDELIKSCIKHFSDSMVQCHLKIAALKKQMSSHK